MVRHRVLAEADRRADRLRPGRRSLPFPAGAFRLARRQPDRRGDGHRGHPDHRAAAPGHRRGGHGRQAVDRHLALGPLRAGPCPAARAGLVGLRLCHRPAHFHLLSRDLSLRALRPQHRPRRPAAVSVAARRHGHAPGERRRRRPPPAHGCAGLDRHRHDGGLHRHRTDGSRHAFLADHAGRRSATARSSSAGTARRRPSSPTSRRPARRRPSPQSRRRSHSRAPSSGRRCSR